MTAKAVLFDLDGTLLDTLADIGGAMNAVLAGAGLPTHPIAAYKRMVGNGVRALVEAAVPEGKFSNALLIAMREEYHKRSDKETRPYAGVPEMLAKIELPIAILSNKPQPLTEKAVATFFPETDFSIILGARNDVPLKPDPAGALEAAAAMDVDPGSVVYLGDTATDMETAKAAAMKPVGALWGFRDRYELVASGAQAVIERPGDLLPLLV